MTARALALAALAIGCGSSLPREGGSDAGLDVAAHTVCGDGTVDPGEECDDGNLTFGDGCSKLCQVECSFECGTCGARPCIPVCFDGMLSASEPCDDAEADNGGCDNCRMITVGWRCPVPGRPCVPICGDGLIVGPEACDDRNTAAGDGCSEICLLEPSTAVCGNGVIEGAEECDDGPTSGAAGYKQCGPDCRYGGYCGDGIVDPGEDCDLGAGNNVAGYGTKDGCAVNCRFHFCGDGVEDADQGEQCDFGQNNGKAGAPCSLECRVLGL